MIKKLAMCEESLDVQFTDEEIQCFVGVSPQKACVLSFLN